MQKRTVLKKIVGIDISEGRLAFANTFGADEIYKMPFQDLEETTEEFYQRVSNDIKSIFGLENGADIILEATGVELCIQVSVFLASPEARLVQAGMGREFISFPVTEALVKQLNWTGGIRYSTGVYPADIELVASGKIDVERLITNRFKFEDAEKAFELVREGRTYVIKVIMKVSTNLGV